MLTTAHPRGRDAGFSLIEMAVVLAILGIMLGIALPNYQTWIQNAQVRAAAESTMDGLRMARAEAVRRNTLVRFQLLDASCALSATGMTWIVSRADPSGTAANCTAPVPSETASPFIIRAENMINKYPKVTSQGLLVDVSYAPTSSYTSDNAVTFTPMGTVSEALQGGLRINFTTTATGAPRGMRLTVSQNGQIRLCDPSLSASGTDPRRCYSESPAT